MHKYAAPTVLALVCVPLLAHAQQPATTDAPASPPGEESPPAAGALDSAGSPPATPDTARPETTDGAALGPFVPAAAAPPPATTPAAASIPGTFAPTTAVETTARVVTTLADEAAPAPEPASVLPPGPHPLRVTGSFFVRYEERDGYDRLGVSGGRFLEGDAVAYRARLGLATAPIDIDHGNSVVLAFTPQASGFWGQLPSTVADTNVGLHEGFLRLQTPSFHLDVGRFVMNYGDSLIIGSLDWHQTARSFDGARVHVPVTESGAYLDVFGTQLGEGRGGPDTGSAAGDTYFTGAYLGIGPVFDDDMAFDLYALANIWPRTEDQPVDPNDASLGTANQDTALQATLGLRVNNQVEPLDYRFEGALQAGSRPRLLENPSVLAGHADLELGLTPIDQLRLALEGLYASGDNPDTDDAEGYDQLFPTTHKFLGWMDIFGARTNIYGGAFSVGVKPIAPLTLQAIGHVYARTRTRGDVGSYDGAEIDTQAAYQVGRGLKLRGMFAVFVPSEDHYADDAAAHYTELELRYDLK